MKYKNLYKFFTFAWKDTHKILKNMESKTEHFHNHHHHSTKNIFITVLLNLLITVGEVIGGLLSGSVSLLTDATHNFSDVLALILSWIAKKVSIKERTLKQTFGFKRAEIFAAFINSLSLLIISFFLIFEAIQRFFKPAEISSMIVVWLAAASILLNGVSVLLINKEAKESMNMKSAYLHLFTDMMTSIAVLIGGLLMKFFGWYWFDAVLSLLIAGYLIYNSVAILRDAAKIMLEFTPVNIDIKQISDEVQKLELVKNIHHVHIWQLDEKEMLFEAHIDLEQDIRISEFDNLQKKIINTLKKFGLTHFNLQPEWAVDDSKTIVK